MQPACFLSTLPALRFLSTSTRRFPCNPHYISFDQPYVSFRPPLRFLGTHTSFHFDQHYVSFQHKLRFATLSFPCYPHYVYLLTSLCFLATHSMFPCIPQYVSLRPAVRFLATCTTFPCDPQYVSLRPAVRFLAGETRRVLLRNLQLPNGDDQQVKRKIQSFGKCFIQDLHI